MGNRVLTCVYCGHEYPQDTPAHGDKVLTDHITQCEKHPMRAVVSQRDLLRKALVGLVGADDPAELRPLAACVAAVYAVEALATGERESRVEHYQRAAEGWL